LICERWHSCFNRFAHRRARGIEWALMKPEHSSALKAVNRDTLGAKGCD